MNDLTCNKPFKPPRRRPAERWNPNIRLSDKEVRLFTRLWRRPL